MPEQKIDDFFALEAMTKTEAKFKIGDKTFIMKPLTPKKLRDLIKIAKDSSIEMQNFDDMQQIVTFAIDKITVLFPIIFDAEINQDFADNNISIPLCKEIWKAFIKINMLEDILPFFQKAFQMKITETPKIMQKQ